MAKRKAFSTLSLGRLFSLGLGSLFILMLLLVVVSFSAINHISEIFFEYRANARTTIALNANLEDILEARTAALKYRDQPSAAFAQEVRSNLDEFIEDSETYHQSLLPHNQTVEIKALVELAKKYRQAFDSGTKLQMQIRQLVQRLSALGPSAREDLTVALSEIATSGDSMKTHAAALAIQTTMLGRFYTERFLVENKSQDIHRALLEFSTASQIIDSITGVEDVDLFLPRLNSARAKIEEYIDITKKIHRFVLEYLALQRNTMDSFGPEITYKIEKTLDALTAEQNALGANGEKSTDEAISKIAIAVIIILLVSIFASVMFVRWLCSVINKLTNVMVRLAAGEKEESIPQEFLSRKDALGKMSRALLVFKENIELARDVETLRDQQTKLAEYSVKIEEQRQHAEHLSKIDDLTGLNNRRSFDEYMNSILLNENDTREVVVFQIDLDRFKSINDTLGHAAGDAVLIHAAELLNAVEIEDAFAARIGGDEFVLVIRRPYENWNIEAFTTNLREKLSSSFKFDGKIFSPSASIGVAHSTADLSTGLLIRADFALYQAKESGRACHKIFNSKMQEQMDLARGLADDLRSALQTGEIIPFFQPQIDANTGKLHGVEVLVRWNHPTFGLLTPNRFLNVAEHFGMLSELDSLVFNKSIETIKDLEAQGFIIPKVSLNFDAWRLGQRNWETEYESISEMNATLCLELVETILLDSDCDDLNWLLDEWRDRGIEVEIDDFGTGHASIVGLQKIKPNRIKIDRQLINAGSDTEEGRIVLESILDMAKSLSVDVIAEGVETSYQSQLLQSLGCPVQQGFLFARAMSTEDLISYLTDLQKVKSKAA